MQILGGLGTTRDTVVERFYRDVRAFRIYDTPFGTPPLGDQAAPLDLWRAIGHAPVAVWQSKNARSGRK
ncbi:acyl-CoA dehydrogenase family protein [Bradyrhizobium campsiandrae]|uniref:acyl-CoA dehydrogenase family protein n=1 Tax=Bradyrhizobium campsiandrae TaxID=1729892 RepID=UPI0034D1D111